MPEQLLENRNRIQVPFIKVTFGDKNGINYTFGVKTKEDKNFSIPNYVKSLAIRKINGTVNTYTLTLDYPLTENTDPNFMEYVLSSVSENRKITFTYGDMNSPTYIYREEEAIITQVQNSFNISNALITYTIQAVSSAELGKSGSFTFPGYASRKPSDVIISLLNNDKYGLKEMFYGMKNMTLVLSKNIIARDDMAVELEAKTNISILDYLQYLVSCMTPINGNNKALYTITIVDDTTGDFGGPYFRVSKLSNDTKYVGEIGTYDITIGYPTENIVTSFSIENNESFSILYNFNEQISPNTYSEIINEKGEIEQIYSPSIDRNEALFKPTQEKKNWWTRVTQYPITATITLMGLLRPSTLMTHINLNVVAYSRRLAISGLYIIIQQDDLINENGYTTTLKMLRIGGTELE